VRVPYSLVLGFLAALAVDAGILLLLSAAIQAISRSTHICGRCSRRPSLRRRVWRYRRRGPTMRTPTRSASRCRSTGARSGRGVPSAPGSPRHEVIVDAVGHVAPATSVRILMPGQRHALSSCSR
jgi:hypothetical protein